MDLSKMRNKNMDNYKIICTTTDSIEISDKIKTTLLLEKLSVCVQEITNISSSYIWNNKITHEKEILLIIKTNKKNLHRVVDAINRIHNYENPEIISYDFNIMTDLYTKWFDATINENE